MIIPDLTCTCDSDYRSPGDYVVAMAFGITIEEAHALMDAFEDHLDTALDYNGEKSEHLAQLREEYERTVQDCSD